MENVSSSGDNIESVENSNVFHFAAVDPSNIDANKMEEFIDAFNNELCSLMLSQKALDIIYKSFIDLIRKMRLLNKHLNTANNGINSEQAMDMSTNLICRKLSEFSTHFKRCKQFESNESYVPSQEFSLNVRWENRTKEAASIPSLVQCKYQYISITDTIISLFKRADFRELYLDYNESNEKKATDGVYTDFCSGSVFKENQLFQTRPNSLQVEIFTDDLEVCNPLGSKATLHKICAFYFSILNMPVEFRSKLINIPLVALCNSDDLKTKFTDYNDIWRLIVNDLSRLERGIDVGNGLIIAGTLVHMAADNLGANTALGFSENFSSANFYCRFCECDKTECKTFHADVPSKRRTKQNYNKHLATIAHAEKVDMKEMQGIQRTCDLNDLKYFHILDNMAPDIMHDINEGIVPFLLKHLFAYCISKKIIGDDDLKRKIQFHHYGFLNKKNCPSLVSFDKRNLNQNAAQSLCLLQHIPFIFHDYRNNMKLKEVWTCVESLLRVTQIVYSSIIDRDDLNDLEYNIRNHLEDIKQHFGIEMIPKHHFLTHYPAVIRSMGPLKALSSMRFEGKHKTLKRIAGQTNNFINLTKTLATKHQQMASTIDDNYRNKFANGKLRKIDDIFLNDHVDLINDHFNRIEELRETKWLEYNVFNYRKGFFIFENSFLYEIEKIVVKDSNFYFVCIQFDYVEFVKFLNSIKIKKSLRTKYAVIEFSSLKNKNVYDKQILDGEYYIILGTLDLKNICIY